MHRAIKVLICILLLAALVRIVYIARTSHRQLSGDEPNYDSIAINLVTGHGYVRHYAPEEMTPTALRGPSYVFLLAFIYMIFGHNPAIALYFHAGMDVFSCLLLFLISMKLFKNPRAGLLAAFIYAIHPPIIRLTGSVLTETFTIFMTLWAIYEFCCFMESKKLRSICFCALAVGLGALSKPVLALLPLVFAASVYSSISLKQNLKNLAVQFLIIGVLFTPWIIRNAMVFKAFVPGVTTAGFTFWGGVGPVDGKLVPGLGYPGIKPYVFTSIAGLNEVQTSEWFFKDGIRIIRENPLRYLALLPFKVSRLWFLLPLDGPLTKRNILFTLLNIGVGILAVIGIKFARPPRWASVLLGLLVIYFTVVHMFFFCEFRYFLPVYAFMFPFSAAGVLVAWIRLRTGFHKTYTN